MELLNSLHGALSAFTPAWAAVLGIVLVLFALGFTGAPLAVWAGLGLVALVGFGAPLALIAVFVVLAVVFLVTPIRRALSGAVMGLMEKLEFLPTISSTEQEAIDAGTVWVEGELFSGKPDTDRLLAQAYAGLTPEEQAFLDGPVEELCAMTDDWEIWQRRDLPTELWDKLKKDRFFGLIIPTEYGGHGFSPSLNSAVVAKVASASSALGITVMVPNSLGPAELLSHFGTQTQKDYWLPKLASGEMIPSFALTEPGAGSDAGAISSRGEVFRGEDGDLYIRLNWLKRYITLAAISDVLGLAFKLFDPQNLLGKGENLGITCALVPTTTEGVVLGKRHDPLGVPFWNCPTEGHDVVVKLEEAVIGGMEGVGRGWRMLMQSLAAGRGISLPASATAGVKQAARVAGAHSLIRKQFGLSIGKFEGIEEPLARIGGWAYTMEAARRYTNGGLDTGAAPAVVTAMMKYQTTELFRKAVNDTMDILGGNAISRGPRNPIAAAYIGIPVSITVEGANILTRTLMVFGQGAIRCHPYALKEMVALQNRDVKAFDAAFWPHIGHVVRNAFRGIGLSLSRGWLAGSPVGGPAATYWRKMQWSSATFAFLADLAMGTLGGDLKRKEKLTGRFADIFSWMYFGTAVLARFEAEGRQQGGRAVHAVEHGLRLRANPGRLRRTVRQPPGARRDVALPRASGDVEPLQPHRRAPERQDRRPRRFRHAGARRAARPPLRRRVHDDGPRPHAGPLRERDGDLLRGRGRRQKGEGRDPLAPVAQGAPGHADSASRRGRDHHRARGRPPLARRGRSQRRHPGRLVRQRGLLRVGRLARFCHADRDRRASGVRRRVPVW